MSSDASGEVLARLRAYFGHSAFREGQEQIVAAVLGGRDRPGQRNLPRDEQEIARRKELEHRKLEQTIELEVDSFRRIHDVRRRK